MTRHQQTKRRMKLEAALSYFQNGLYLVEDVAGKRPDEKDEPHLHYAWMRAEGARHHLQNELNADPTGGGHAA